MILAIAASTAASAAGASSTYPVELILTEARSACEAAISSPSGNAQLGEGWSKANPSLDSWLSDELAEKWDSMGTQHQQFQKSIAGRRVYLIFGTAHDPKLTQHLCTLRDPEAVLKGDGARIERWAGRAPDSLPASFSGLAGMEDVSFRMRWSPGLPPHNDESQVNYAVGFGLTYFTGRFEQGPTTQ